MMKAIILFILNFNIVAGTIRFIGPCNETPLAHYDININSESNVGVVTIDILKKNKISYIGSELGLNSIFDTPVDKEAIEFLSPNELMAYGWCYSVNGFEPNSYPHEYSVSQGDDILWWYGYAHYKDGRWLTQCTPSYKRKSDFLCLN